MMNAFKKVLSFLLAITIIFGSAYVGLSEVDFGGLFAVKSQAASVDDLLYEIVDGEAVITGIDGWAESTKITIPSYIDGYKVTKIANSAFSSNDTIEEIIIADTVKEIGEYAFEECDNLRSVRLPKFLTKINRGTFFICPKLEKINIPDSVEYIDNFAFPNCYSLKKINIPDKVTNIGYGSFRYCHDLKEIVFGDNLTSIDDIAFEGCDALTYIKLPKSIKIIGENAFNDCSSLSNIWYEGSETEKKKISLAGGNVAIKNATWHYNVCDESNHKYSCAWDAECNICGWMRNNYVKTIKLSASTVTYNGQVRTPSVIVKDSKGKTLVKGTDYKVTVPSGRKLPGIYKYTITFMGKYSGTKTLTLKILPATVNASKMTAAATTSSIRINWPKVTGATGYKVYQYNANQKKYVQIATVTGNTYKKTGLKAGTTYHYKVKAYKKLSNGTVIEGALSNAFATATKCAAPTISSLVASSGQKTTLKWSAVTGATGYEVYFSTKKDSGYQKVVSTTSKTASKTFAKAAKGQRRYFKVRAYKKVNGKTIYGNWSAVKSVVIK